ncbi:hypothetical protein LguiA_033245 [Lonicera macranthoides]
MNTFFCSHKRRPISTLALLLLKSTTKNPDPNSQISITTYHHLLRRLFSHRSWLSFTGKPLINWPQLPPTPSQKPNLNQNEVTTIGEILSNPSLLQEISPPSKSHKNPNSNLNQNDFTTICEILSNPSLSPGPDLENALNQTGIELGPSQLQEIFDRFGSSPKPLFTLFLWVEKQPSYEFSVTVFNSMINLLGKAREFDLAWSLIIDRIDTDRGPDMDTFTILIRRFARAGMVVPAIRTYKYASNLDLIRDSNLEMSLFEILLDSFCKERHVKAASEYFARKRQLDPSWIPSTRVYNILLNGWFRSRKLKHAERLWVEMKKENVKPSVVTYGTLVEGYCRMRRVEVAIELIDEMKQEGIEPNAIVYNPIIDALGEAGRFKEVLGMMERFLVLESGPTLPTYNSLVKGFCKAGDLVGASKILKMMISKGNVPTPTTYNYFFRYFSRFGKIEEGMNLYTKMIESGYNPDRLTYHLLVKMLCEEERLDLAMQITKEMRGRGFDLDLAISTMLMHLLLKMHRFDEAFGEFEDMIRRGVVPQYLTYEKMRDMLKREGMNEMARKLRDMMASVPHSMKLPNTYNGDIDRDSSRLRRRSIIRKAEVMSDILKTKRNPREIVKSRSGPKNNISSASR